MSLKTYEAPASSPFAKNPFYALGVADAYDEHQNGENVHNLVRRADEMLDAAPTGLVPANLYVCGYANTVHGILNGHIAQINAQSEVAHQWLDHAQGRAPVAVPVAAPTLDLTRSDSETTHVFCCNPDLALCGSDVSDTPVVPAGVGDDCVVCLDLEQQPCPHCEFNPDEATE
ncbi:hypothetical protein ACFC8N_42525 [Streptomyces sp. NPDC055966]|uniref:hypothetical protein n=1 Tax=Streptomyces sp. NPDC055966 TaxID=3345669 RepID=UPI0035DF984E